MSFIKEKIDLSAERAKLFMKGEPTIGESMVDLGLATHYDTQEIFAVKRISADFIDSLKELQVRYPDSEGRFREAIILMSGICKITVAGIISGIQNEMEVNNLKQENAE